MLNFRFSDALSLACKWDETPGVSLRVLVSFSVRVSRLSELVHVVRPRIRVQAKIRWDVNVFLGSGSLGFWDDRY